MGTPSVLVPSSMLAPRINSSNLSQSTNRASSDAGTGGIAASSALGVCVALSLLVLLAHRIRGRFKYAKMMDGSTRGPRTAPLQHEPPSPTSAPTPGCETSEPSVNPATHLSASLEVAKRVSCGAPRCGGGESRRSTLWAALSA